MWLVLAVLSAISSGLVSVTIKAGMKNINSDLGMFLRTLVVLVFTFIMVLIAGSLGTIKDIKLKEWIFIIASGLCTGFSWLCYFKALQIGDVNKVVPIDKLSTVLTMIFAITILDESFWWLMFVAMGIMVVGTMLMINKKKATVMPTAADATEEQTANIEVTQIGHKSNFITSNLWLVLAILSLVFASFTSILAKIGMQLVNSNLGTFLRTIVVLVMAFLIALGKKKLPEIKKLTKANWVFLFISGILTGVSWLCYYAAIQTGIVSVVVPIDKLSIVVSVVLAYFLFKEKLNLKAIIGLILLTGGTLLLLI